MAQRLLFALSIALLPLLLAACPKGEEKAPAAPDGAGAEGPGEVEAAPPAPPPPEPVPAEAFAVAPEGDRQPLPPEEETGGVSRGASFEVRSPLAFRTVRVRLLDGRDRVVPSRDQVTIGQGTVVRIAPEEPLAEGGGYRILVDDPHGPLVRDIEGRGWLLREFRFRVADGGAAPGAEGAEGR